VGAAGDEAIRTAPERLHDTDPLWVARLGAACDPAASPPRPLYLKQADAHPQERGRIARR
jgi:tRNA threonylcarbamoyladenosine biosynthesis protein TsaB